MGIEYTNPETRTLCRLVLESQVRDLLGLGELFAVRPPPGYTVISQDVTFRCSEQRDGYSEVKVLIRAKARENSTKEVVLLPTELLEHFGISEASEPDTGLQSPFSLS